LLLELPWQCISAIKAKERQTCHKAKMTNPLNGSGSIETNGSAAVLVVGAGPTGLLLASELQRRGISCHLIEARSEPMHWDRATIVHPRSLQIFEAMGLADKFLEASCRQRVIKIHADGKALGALELSGCGSIYGFNLGISEEVTEAILTDSLHQHGGKVNRSSRLIGFTVEPGGVLAEIECHGSRYTMNVQWVVGCDGVHSITREQCGIGMEGHDIVKQWAVFDVTLKDWRETYEATFAYLDTPAVILTAIPNHRWRVYLRPSSQESDLLADAAETLRTYVPFASFVDVENPTRFQCHTKVATRFRAGPILLAGDAAHICSPAEGHGMNCGLHDAFNLGWKIALVCQGADPILLDSYEMERRPAAELVAQSGDHAERNLTMTDAGERSNRNQTFRDMFAEEKARHREILAETELNVDYSGSPIVFGDSSDGIAAGYTIPDTIVVQRSGERPCRMVELTQRAGHTLLLLAGPDANGPELIELAAALQEFTADSLLFETAFTLATRSDLPASIGHLGPIEAGLLEVNSITLLAVRPDGYIGLRSDRNHLRALKCYESLIMEGACETALHREFHTPTGEQTGS
jgi:2-polyprenyl-6-methoxyphenol hydroxylase-like FAD-dependent oxidoreductase